MQIIWYSLESTCVCGKSDVIVWEASLTIRLLSIYYRSWVRSSITSTDFLKLSTTSPLTYKCMTCLIIYAISSSVLAALTRLSAINEHVTALYLSSSLLNSSSTRILNPSNLYSMLILACNVSCDSSWTRDVCCSSNWDILWNKGMHYLCRSFWKSSLSASNSSSITSDNLFTVSLTTII